MPDWSMSQSMEKDELKRHMKVGTLKKMNTQKFLQIDNPKPTIEIKETPSKIDLVLIHCFRLIDSECFFNIKSEKCIPLTDTLLTNFIKLQLHMH